MTSPKLHHYVPQFYLRHFTTPGGRFWVWDKTTRKVFLANPGGVAAETHFYRVPEFIGTEVDPLFLEKDLARLEGDASQITQGWIGVFDGLQAGDKVAITQDERWAMAVFLSVQFLRTAEQRDILALFSQEHGQYKSGVSTDEKINLHAYMLCSGGLVESIADRIDKSIWIFARNPTDIPFWTSDNPVCFKTGDNRMWLKGPGILSEAATSSSPLLPDTSSTAKNRSTGPKSEDSTVECPP